MDEPPLDLLLELASLPFKLLSLLSSAQVTPVGLLISSPPLQSIPKHDGLQLIWPMLASGFRSTSSKS